MGECVMKDNLVEVVIAKHNAVVFKLIKYTTWHLSARIHNISNNLLMHHLKGGRESLTNARKDYVILVSPDVPHPTHHLEQSLKRSNTNLIISE